MYSNFDREYYIVKTDILISIAQFIGIASNLAILDVRLAFGLGSDLCSEIKNTPESKHIPVILYSASYGLNEIAKNCQADAYIEKPFDLDKLLKTVEYIVS